MMDQELEATRARSDYPGTREVEDDDAAWVDRRALLAEVERLREVEKAANTLAGLLMPVVDWVRLSDEVHLLPGHAKQTGPVRVMHDLREIRRLTEVLRTPPGGVSGP